ncbi:MAG TPA: class I SAM-dependent methyltransferase [Caldisericia bacterium]|nr:class I SAM-dependent methyltransferase [Caldisericia bacterium]
MSKAEFFNNHAENWDNHAKHDQAKLNEIVEMIGFCAGDRVIDVGTGTGVMVPHIMGQIGENGSLEAYDIAEKMLEMASRKFSHKNLKFVCADAIEVPGNDLFDVIVCYSVFPHFDDGKRAVASFARLLKKGGRLAICHSQSRDEINHIHAGAGPEIGGDYLPKGAELADLMRINSLDVAKIVDDDRMYFLLGVKR